MKRKIIGDSSTDSNNKFREEFIKEMIDYDGVLKTAWPSPQDFIERVEVIKTFLL